MVRALENAAVRAAADWPMFILQPDVTASRLVSTMELAPAELSCLAC